MTRPTRSPSTFRRDLEITAKPDRTFVTQADTAIERAIRARITAAHPGPRPRRRGVRRPRPATPPTRWYIDPIDGTHNFVRGVPLFGTLLAVERDGELQAAVLSAPALRERWWARRGGGAWARGADDAEPRRIHVSQVAAIGDAQVLYGSGHDIEESGGRPGSRRCSARVWRERGFGDFWGYALLAEGAAEAMVEVDLVVVGRGRADGPRRGGRRPRHRLRRAPGDRHGHVPRDERDPPRRGAGAAAGPGWARQRVAAGLGTGLRAAVGNARPEVRLGLFAGLAAVAWALLVLDPLGPATIDPDASSSVLYFDRIVNGQRLEAFVPTTPKPLLTLEYGLAWIGTQDGAGSFG